MDQVVEATIIDRQSSASGKWLIPREKRFEIGQRRRDAQIVIRHVRVAECEVSNLLGPAKLRQTVSVHPLSVNGQRAEPRQTDDGLPVQLPLARRNRPALDIINLIGSK